MNSIYITETEILVASEQPENSARISAYSKEGLLKTINDFPDLSHPLPVYKFLYWTGEVFTTVDLASFARENNLNQTVLRRIHTYSGSHKGLIKCPDNITSNLEKNRIIYKQKLKPSKGFFAH